MTIDSQNDPFSAIPSAMAVNVAKAASAGTADGIRETAADVWGGLIGDRVKQWRQRNLINTLEKTAKYLEEKGIVLEQAKSLPDGVLYTIFEGSSKSEQSEIQDLWAALLASEMAGTDSGEQL